MKVAEFFAELGFKVTGADELKAFETSLTNIAQAARDAVAALKGLATVKMPRGTAAVAGGTTANQPNTVQQWWAAFQAKQRGITNLMAPAANQPTAPGGLPTSALQGLKMLGMFALKLGGIASIALVLKKLVSTLIAMTGATMKASVGMEKFTGQTGVSRATLKAWELAATKVGVSAEETEAAFKHLTRVRQDIAWGRDPQAAAAFGMIGVDVSDTLENVFYKMGNRLKQMGPGQAQMFGAMTGFTDDWNYFLRQQTEKVKDMSHLVLSNEQQASVMQLNSAWQTLKMTMSLLSDQITTDFAPKFTKAIESISKAAEPFVANKELRKDAYSFLANPDRMWGLAIGAARAGLFSGGTHNKTEHKIDMTVNGQATPKETAQEIRRVLFQTYYQRAPMMPTGQ